LSLSSSSNRREREYIVFSSCARFLFFSRVIDRRCAFV
jgi:hypothetical protein